MRNLRRLGERDGLWAVEWSGGPEGVGGRWFAVAGVKRYALYLDPETHTR